MCVYCQSLMYILIACSMCEKCLLLLKNTSIQIENTFNMKILQTFMYIYNNQCIYLYYVQEKYEELYRGTAYIMGRT